MKISGVGARIYRGDELVDVTPHAIRVRKKF